MSTQRVSSDFNKAFGRLNGVEDAKKAENTLNNIPVPVGWSGELVISDVKTGTTKEQAKEGKTSGGDPYLIMEYTVVQDKAHQGKKLKKLFVFNETHNEKTNRTVTAAERFSWFLNELETAGLPRKLREDHDGVEDLIAWMLDKENPRHVHGTVEHDDYSRDKKKLTVRELEAPVDNTTSMSPAPASKKADSPEPPANGPKMVEYMEKKWELVKDNGDTVVIKSTTTGKERTIPKSDLEG